MKILRTMRRFRHPGFMQSKDGRLWDRAMPRCALFAVALTAGTVWAQEPDLTQMSLEDLMGVQVTSVSKKAEKRSEAAAAVYVITSEDIRHSGASTIPEVLRMVPGVQVARLDASKWSVTIRGSSGRYANKLLVLIDGRSVYTPLYSGVEWESRDVVLSDVERIEVIRGPGGTLWGANAVNGIINIVTKKASETPGGLAVARVGTEENGLILRYGEKLGEHGAYRFSGKYVNVGDAVYSDGRKADDHWHRGMGSFRYDWERDDDSLMFQAGGYSTETSQAISLASRRPPYARVIERDSSFAGGNLVLRWNHQFSEDADFQVQAYYDRSTQHAVTIAEHRDTFDVEFQHRMRLNARHELVWGMDYRVFRDQLDGTPYVSMGDPTSSHQLVSLFLQDEITLTERLRAWVGAKIEYNDFSGVEIQPGIRAAYTPNEWNTLWASISRAVRTPSIIETDGRLLSQTFPGGMITLFGDEDFQAEDLTAYELGYRVAPLEKLAFDLALYYHDYKELRSFDFRRPFFELRPFPPHLVIPIGVANATTAEAYGVELGVDMTPRTWWRARLAYSWSEVHVQVNPKVFDPLTFTLDGDAPEQQVYLQNLFDIGDAWEFDTVFRYVDALPSLGVDDYLTMDVRLAWKPRENLEIALVGQNLLERHHGELTSSFVNSLPTDVERSVFARVSWRF
ncbi:MAG: TonB-dependent receptor [Candidatus Hydrogenedentes bacterium]|nr:TonB-dependent receptor [Candidatus Hydrogenedentota bacterium]